jgi:hypothetical protein
MWRVRRRDASRGAGLSWVWLLGVEIGHPVHQFAGGNPILRNRTRRRLEYRRGVIDPRIPATLVRHRRDAAKELRREERSSRPTPLILGGMATLLAGLFFCAMVFAGLTTGDSGERAIWRKSSTRSTCGP